MIHLASLFTENSIQGAFVAWAAVITLVLVGIFALLGIFDKVTKQKRQDANQLDDRLITLLKGEVDALTRKVTDNEVRMVEMENKLTLYAHENEVLRNVMQGRDPETVKMLQDMQRTGDYNASALGRLIVLLEASLSSQGVRIPDADKDFPVTSLSSSKVPRKRRT
jgi:hypothetical protein